MITETPERVHPNQRYTMGGLSLANATYEFVGSVAEFDVLWLPYPQRIMVKFASEPGCNFELFLFEEPGTDWKPNHGAARKKPPTPEQTETIIAMCQCFAQDNRPKEWDNAAV